MALEVLSRRTFQAGDIIFSEGERGDRAYIVQTGAVAIEKGLPEGGRRLLGRIPPGGIFGEMSLVDDKPRMASARSLEETVCLVVPKHLLDKKLAAADPFIVALLRMVIANARALARA